MKTYILLAPCAVDFGRLNNMASAYDTAEEMENEWHQFITESISIAKGYGEEISFSDFELLTADDIASEINNGEDCFTDCWAKVVNTDEDY